jgi:2-dehydro-3-deoxyglucarate aldolase/4-hydroxy-2-oxoheptanedioate aldolase
MKNAKIFREKIKKNQPCFGTVISYSDPSVSEMLCSSFDYLWIDTEHSPFTPDIVQTHLTAIQASDAAALVRVAWNDPILIKPYLDMGADGIIGPMIRTAEEARQLVEACRYPPHGIRGYGPRRASKYGAVSGLDYCLDANKNLLIMAQLEHIDAVTNLDAILAVEGLTGIVLGPMDLAASMGHLCKATHPDVMAAMKKIVQSASKAGLMTGFAWYDNMEDVFQWIELGANWVCIANDFSLLQGSVNRITTAVQSYLQKRG